jgi:hypothetical protein
MFRLIAMVLAGCLLAGCASGPRPKPEAVAAPAVEWSVAEGLSVQSTFAVAAARHRILGEVPVFNASGSTPDTPLVSAEIRVYSLSEETAADLYARAPGGAKAFTLESSDAEILMREFSRGRGGAMRTAPRLTLREGQRGNIVISSQIPYVSGFDVRAEGPVLTADPVVSTTPDGMEVSLLISRADGGRYLLELEYGAAELLLPLPAAGVKFLGTEAQVQTPMSFQSHLSCKGEVDPSRVLALTGMTDARGRALLLLVRIQPAG